MKISIITICYNSSDTISDTIESILEQSYNNIQYVIIDGKSTDNTLELITSYEKKFEEKNIEYLYVSDRDDGLYDALNKGISLCNGDIIGVLHSDDIFENSFVLEKISQKFDLAKYDAIYGNLVYVNKNDTSKILRFWRSKQYSKRDLYKGWMPAHPTFFVKRNRFNDLGKYNTKYKIAADYDLMLRFLLNSSFKAHYIQELITRMRVGGESNQSLKKIRLKMAEDIDILKNNNIFWLKALFLKNISKLLQFFIH